MSDDEYYEFCRTMNAYIQRYDAIMFRRTRMKHWKDSIFHFLFSFTIGSIVASFFNTNDNNGVPLTVWHYIRFNLYTMAWLLLLWILVTVITVCMTMKPIQTIVTQQFDLYQQINSYCAEISRRCRSSANALSTTTGTSFTPIDVTVSVHWIVQNDLHGKNYTMDRVNIVIITTKQSCEASHSGSEVKSAFVLEGATDMNCDVGDAAATTTNATNILANAVTTAEHTASTTTTSAEGVITTIKTTTTETTFGSSHNCTNHAPKVLPVHSDPHMMCSNVTDHGVGNNKQQQLLQQQAKGEEQQYQRLENDLEIV